MQHRLVRLLCVLAVFGLGRAAAQTNLNDFSAFVQTDQTYFVGGWSVGDDVTPSAGFTQGTGVYSILNATSADTAYVDYFFASGLDLTGSTTLSLTAQLAAGNTATALHVALIDSGMNTATATFDLTGYSTSSFITATSLLTLNSLSLADVIGFRITGSDVNGSSVVSVTLDQLTAGVSAVPEPSTYALLAGLSLFGLAVWRRRSNVAR